MPADELPAKFNWLKKNGFNGVNVTIPHKQAVMPLIDEIVDDARSVGAVNTIVFDDVSNVRSDNKSVFDDAENAGAKSNALENASSRSTGHNTDVYGFSKSLAETLKHEQIDTEWSKSAIVLGCGGAARAVVAGLCELGYLDISIFGRDKQKANDFVVQLAKSLGPRGQLLLEGSLLRCVESLTDEILSTKFVLINATPAGQNEEPLPDWLSNAVAKLDKRALVYDLVYSKTEFPTPLEECARANSLASVDGLDMLVYQAARAFEIWTGRTVPPDCMKAGLNRAFRR